MNPYSPTDNKDIAVSLYEEALQHLREDLEIVKHFTTRVAISDEIKFCEKRLKEIMNY